jgi:hypothetical protein
MNLEPVWLGYLIFFLVPIVLWMIGVAVVKRPGFEARAFAFVAGSDNRLSLSRLQAFSWTLVIFGSFAAAMAIHTKIVPITAQERKDKVAVDKAAAAKAAQAEKDAGIAKESAVKEADTAKKAAATADAEAEAAAKLAAAATVTDVQKADAAQKAKAKADLTAKAAALATVAAEKTAAAKKAAADRIAADKAANVTGDDWVSIPAGLLALAGIALGSGVFSSLISAVNSEDKTACITGLQSQNLAVYLANINAQAQADAATIAADPNATAQARNEAAAKAAAAAQAAAEALTFAPPRFCLIINGLEMKKAGRVRFGNVPAHVRDWNDEGTQIIVDVPPNARNTLVVDTANGKLCYKLNGNYQAFTLGEAVFYYEFADLFRDDKNPASFDLMKFQMFGWTIIAIVIYSYLFLGDLNDHISTLPMVPSSIVTLTGLSQAGYLTSKAASSVNKPAS